MIWKYWRYGVVFVVAFVIGFGLRHTVPTASFAAGESAKKAEQSAPAATGKEPEEKEEPKKGKTKFEEVQIFSYASGLTGLFDKSSGKLYLYDTNINGCVAIRQLNRLGESMRVIK